MAAVQPVRAAAKVTGAIFLALGLLGIVGAGAVPLWECIVGGSVLCALLHAGFGLAGFLAARTAAAARAYLIGGGIVYAVVCLVSSLSRDGDAIRYALAAVMIVLGTAPSRLRGNPPNTR